MDYGRRIDAIKVKKDAADRALAQLEVKQEQLSTRKNEILTQFKELGIASKDARAELERLEEEIESQLAEAERVIAENS
jgi:hypothetical protein